MQIGDRAVDPEVGVFETSSHSPRMRQKSQQAALTCRRHNKMEGEEKRRARKRRAHKSVSTILCSASPTES